MSQWLDRFTQLSIREKWLVIVSALVVIYLLFDVLVFTPQQKERDRLQTVFEKHQQQVTDLSSQVVTYSMALNTDPNAGKKKQLQGLNGQLVDLDKALSGMSAGLIPSNQLPKLLQDVLLGLDDLTLVSINTLPVDELLLSGVSSSDEDELADDVGEESVGVFKHGVEMTFQGGYFEVVKYLKALESLEWRFYWDVMDYRVAQYPKAEVSLQVYTLSTDVGAFGG